MACQLDLPRILLLGTAASGPDPLHDGDGPGPHASAKPPPTNNRGLTGRACVWLAHSWFEVGNIEQVIILEWCHV